MRITHHDLRPLFATRCIEAGVDIPTVRRWLGHKGGGALAMKTYGHLRDQHSTTMAQATVGWMTLNTDGGPLPVSLRPGGRFPLGDILLYVFLRHRVGLAGSLVFGEVEFFLDLALATVQLPVALLMFKRCADFLLRSISCDVGVDLFYLDATAAEYSELTLASLNI